MENLGGRCKLFMLLCGGVLLSKKDAFSHQKSSAKQSLYVLNNSETV